MKADLGAVGGGRRGEVGVGCQEEIPVNQKSGTGDPGGSVGDCGHSLAFA